MHTWNRILNLLLLDFTQVVYPIQMKRKNIHRHNAQGAHTHTPVVSEREKEVENGIFRNLAWLRLFRNTTDCCVCMWSVQKNDWLYALFPIFPAYVCFETVLRACVRYCCRRYYYCFYATPAFATLPALLRIWVCVRVYYYCYCRCPLCMPKRFSLLPLFIWCRWFKLNWILFRFWLIKLKRIVCSHLLS